MGKRVLIADDSATIQTAFAMALGGEDLTLVSARSFDEALTALRQTPPDLLIADVALAGRTGYELCAVVKSDPAFASVRVYILGSTQTPYDEVRGRDAGADGNLTKPFDSQSLIDRLAQALMVPARAHGPAMAPTPPPVTGAAPEPRPPAPIDWEDDYGEFTIERPSAPSAAPAALRPPAPAPPRSAAPATASVQPPPGPDRARAPAGLRPSLIPGANPFAPSRLAPGGKRPGAPAAPPIGRPASTPQPVGFTGAPQVGRAPAAPPPAQAPATPNPTAGRTIMGLPAVNIPNAPGPRAPAPADPHPPTPTPAGMPRFGDGTPARPSSNGPGSFPAGSTPPVAFRAPVTPAPAQAPARAPLPATPEAPSLGAAISARVDERMAAFAARGPEWEAVARISREVIEQVVWEVVPELAEIIIREHVERLAKK